MPENPERFTFRGQRSGEQTLLVLRRHPWFFFQPGLKVIVVVLIIVLAIKFLGFSTPTSIIFFISLPFVAYEIGQAWFRWINTVYVLTNERIITVLQRHFFARQVTEAPLDNVMTVTHEIAGPIRSILNFGDVAIRSSGASENEIVLKDVFDPFEVQQKILGSAKR